MFERNVFVETSDHAARDGMSRSQKELFDRVFLDDLPVLHHGDAIAKCFRHFHLVRDENDSNPEIVDDFSEHGKDEFRVDGIERRRRFIRQEKTRIHRQRASDTDALLLTARQFRRVGPCVRRKSDVIEKFLDARGDLFRPLTRDPKRIGDILPNRFPHEEIEMLENNPHPASLLAENAVILFYEIQSVEPNLPRVGTLQQVETADERRFSRSRQTD